MKHIYIGIYGCCMTMYVPMYVGTRVVVYVCMYVYTSNSFNVNTQTVTELLTEIALNSLLLHNNISY